MEVIISDDDNDPSIYDEDEDSLSDLSDQENMTPNKVFIAFLHL